MADYPTVEQALNLMIEPKDEVYTRTCRIYLLNANITGDISDRKFFTVSGRIIWQDEEGVKLEIEIEKYEALQ